MAAQLKGLFESEFTFPSAWGLFHFWCEMVLHSTKIELYIKNKQASPAQMRESMLK